MRQEEKKMSSLRIVGGKDGPENGSARLERFYRRIAKSPMMGRGDRFWRSLPDCQLSVRNARWQGPHSKLH